MSVGIRIYVALVETPILPYTQTSVTGRLAILRTLVASALWEAVVEGFMWVFYGYG